MHQNKTAASESSCSRLYYGSLPGRLRARGGSCQALIFPDRKSKHLSLEDEFNPAAEDKSVFIYVAAGIGDVLHIRLDRQPTRELRLIK